MNQMQRIAHDISPEFRRKILLTWLPNAKPVSMANPDFANLFEAYYIWVEPSGIKKPDCPQCLHNVYENWTRLAPYLKQEEQDTNLLNAL